MRLSLKVKIVGLVIIPILALLFYGGTYLQTRIEILRKTDSIVDYGNLLKANSQLIHQTQIERAKNALYLGDKIDIQQLNQHRAIVDGKMAEVFKQFKNCDFNKKVDDLLISSQKNLSELRDSVNRKTIVPAEATQQMTQLISGLIEIDVIASSLEPLDGIEMNMLSLTMFELGKEYGGRFRANLLNVLSANKPITSLQVSTLENLRTGVMVNLNSPVLMISNEAHEKINVFLKSTEWKKVQDIYSKVVSKANEGDFQEDPQAFYNAITGALNTVGEIIQFETGEVQTKIQNLEASTRRRFIVDCVVISLILLMIAIFATGMIRKLTRDLSRITEAVGGSGEQVSSASLQISQGAERLSSATQTQASSLEETSASLTQISGMAESNLKGAEQADSHAKEVYEITLETHKSMEALTRAMTEISDSNERIVKLVTIIDEIAQKTQIIDDIVFKTQLLSFNASVEAERAGEHGRGFSVVAQEVGNLAQVSGKAAAEISALVKNSIREAESVASENKVRVEAGGELAGSTKNKMENVLSKLNEVIEAINKITAASREQSQGVAQITNVIETLNQSTQGTAGTAEESASASAELTGQAQSLMTLVNDLRLIVLGTEKQSRLSGDKSA